jgi:hypothetical protein
MNSDLCQKRSRDGGKCELSDAIYGVTIRSPALTRVTFYSIQVCKMHFDQYLSDPKKFIEEHEHGSLNFLLSMGRSRDG